MEKIPIKVGQIWQSKQDKRKYLVAGKKSDKFLCKVLTDKPYFYAGTHRMSRMTLWIKFDLVKE